MREARIGRVVAASLHQGVADVLPSRLDFYEDWLKPMALRQGTLGVGPFSAVLSFLRHEGPPYAAVMSTAGRYAADWLFVASSPTWRALCRRLPVRLRTGVALSRLEGLVSGTVTGRSPRASASRGPQGIVLCGSPFCVVREPAPHPLCGFYVAAGTRFLELFGVGARLEARTCAGMVPGDPCTLVVAPAPGEGEGNAA